VKDFFVLIFWYFFIKEKVQRIEGKRLILGYNPGNTSKFIFSNI